VTAPPIGVFDSGVGGLSVLREIRALLPDEDLVYVADSAHCPYGEKSHTFIRQRAATLSRFLIEQRARVIVVACNTATAAAIEDLRAHFVDVPIVGMEPAIKPAAAATRSGVVGVLATGTTLGADRFALLAERFADGIEVLTQPCPGLVEQVEAGDLESERTLDLLRAYTTPLLDRGADTLVLGCTHYPFLRPALVRVVGPDVTILDTGKAVARQVARVVDAPGPQDRTGGVSVFATDLKSAPVLERLWGQPLNVSGLEP
jgi:glutamate racemase